MPIKRLDHYSIRTTDLDSTTRFYTEVLGFEVGPRPVFPFPGVWLYNNGLPVVHVIGIDPADTSGLMDYLGERNQDGKGSGMVDHVAFYADEIDEIRARIEATGAEYKERQVPALNLAQIFVEDPSGIVVELNFNT
jgi:catechol 2,3-dioxygenase-like lactoylglutathione lyase family enzyme